MPIEHRIDAAAGIVLAAMKGTFSQQDFLGYQAAVWTNPEVKDFHELMDMRKAGRVEYGSALRVSEMAKAAVDTQGKGRPTKLAIVAEQDYHRDIAEMYRAFREAEPKSRKKVKLFRTYEEALGWLQE